MHGPWTAFQTYTYQDMKTLRTFLRPLLALLLALASMPAWACARSCGSSSEASLACVRLCARSQALLTQGGKLASLGARSCGVEAKVNRAPAVLGAVAPLQAPAITFTGVSAAPALVLPSSRPLASATRGPPNPSPYLASQHPLANAPPIFV